jgi:uncharacterized protein YidB (DUF937 family)
MKRILKALTPLSRQRSSGSLLLIIDAFIENHGGPKAILGRMQQQGMGRLVMSWGDRGPTEPISGEQLHRLFGTSPLRAAAAAANLPPPDLVNHLARVLPERIYRHLCLNIPSLALRE